MKLKPYLIIAGIALGVMILVFRAAPAKLRQVVIGA